MCLSDLKPSGAGLGIGLVDQITGAAPADAQPAASSFSQTEQHLCLDQDDASNQDLLYKSTLDHLPHPNESSKCTNVSSVLLSDIAAAREAAGCEDPIMKMIEVKEVCDGLNVCYTGDALTLENAFRCGLISASVYLEIIQRQKTIRDKINLSAAEDVSLIEPVQEVNRLILQCLSRDKSLTSERSVNTLRSFSDGLLDQETMSEEVMSNSEGLKVDAAIQCDLMRFNSTLVVLENQEQFMGLVLPRGEIRSVSTSFQCEQQITSNEFTSTLFDNREKIAAFYIPENSEVVDIKRAVQNGLIDTYTAEILKSVEIPDVLPEVDHLNEKFSSWLMYKKLRLDGCHHAADCLEVDCIPSHAEATQLFTSYLTLNSYVDPESGRRVLVLDRQLSEMVKIFLEDSLFFENKNLASLTLNVGELSGRLDLEIPLHINEETEGLMEHRQQAFDEQNFVLSINGPSCIDEEEPANDEAPKPESLDHDLGMDTTESRATEETMFHNNTNWTKSDDLDERGCLSPFQIHNESSHGEGLCQRFSPTLCSPQRIDIGSPPTMANSESSIQIKFKSVRPWLPQQNTESLCSESECTDSIHHELLHSDSLSEVQHDDCDLEGALSNGLVKETTLLKLLDLQSHDNQSVAGEEEDTVFVLEQLVPDASTGSNIALSVIEKQSLFRSGCLIGINESLQPGSVPDERVDLDSEASSYPEENFTHSICDDHRQHLNDFDEDERFQTMKKGAVKVLDMSNGEANMKDGEKEEEAVYCQTTGNVGEMSNDLHHSSPSVCDHQSSRFIAHLIDESPLPAEDSDSQVVINSQQLEVVIENLAPTLIHQSRPSSTDPESQTQYSVHTDHSKSDSSPIDNDFFIPHVGVKEGKLDILTPQSDREEGRAEIGPRALLSRLNGEATSTVDHLSPRDLVESAVVSESRGHIDNSDDITEDGRGMTLLQQAALCSESEFSVGSAWSCSQNGRSVVSNEVVSANAVHLKCLNGGDEEYCTKTTSPISPETILSGKDSQQIAAQEVESSTDSLSSERQRADIFTVTTDTEQMSVSTCEQAARGKENVGENVSALEVDSGQSETILGLSLGSYLAQDEKPSPASEHLQIRNTDFLSESCVASDGSSSASTDVRTHVDEGGVITKVTDVRDLQKAEFRDTERSIAVIKNTPFDEGHLQENDTPHPLTGSSSPDLLVDVLKKKALSSNNEDKGNSQLQEEEVTERTEQSEGPNIQLQLLQVLQTVSSSQDLSMLQEVMNTLNSTLGGDAVGADCQEERWHTLESIKEESSEGEDDSGLCRSAADSAPPSPQSSGSSHVCKVDELYSIQDFLECVGTLQDHADVLEDVRKDLLIQAPIGNNMEELQIQKEDFQSLESQFTRVAGILTADMEKAHGLLNSAESCKHSGDIPTQIHQDLSSTYQDLETDFTAVSQMFAERSCSLTQAMETGKIHLESTYQKHLSDLEELAAFLQNNPGMCDVDLKPCDVDTLKHFIQQNRDSESDLLKEARLKLEDVTFDIQCFISEHAQFLSPAQSSYLLKFLSTTQRAFRSQAERLITQRSALGSLLDTKERESQEKVCLGTKHHTFLYIHVWFVECK
ncbi:uncharacterized protein AB9W97_019288 isoform 2-T2 [Spinachia spinachia]